MEGMSSSKESKKIEIRFDSSFFAGLILGTLGAYTAITLIFGGVGSLNLGGSAKTLKQVAKTDTTAGADTNTAATQVNIPDVTSEDHIRGDVNAPLTWVEYSDFECPFCKSFYPTMQQMLSEFDGEINLVYRHFPLSFHANAQKEAEATECANELGGNDAFWAYHDKIFERTTSNGTGFALSALAPLAKELGLDENKFTECLDGGKYAKHVTDELQSGQQAGVNGTPGSFLIGKDGQVQLISGAVPYEQIKAAINGALR